MATSRTGTPSGIPHVVSRETWLDARRALLEREKALTRLKDEVAQARRELPWVRVDAPYVFDTPNGPRTLADLFMGRCQLIVQHFMYAPGWEAGCPSCSFMADHHAGAVQHLAQRDVTLIAVSRAPLVEIMAFQQRMGWTFSWVSSAATAFNRDFGVTFTTDDIASGTARYNYGSEAAQEEMPGISVFVRGDDGQVFHTYSSYGRGVEVMMHTYALLDLVPRGRGEQDDPHPMAWVRHHDRYERGSEEV